MANKYWAGGTGNWNSTTHWSSAAPVSVNVSLFSGSNSATINSGTIATGNTLWVDNGGTLVNLGTVSAGNTGPGTFILTTNSSISGTNLTGTAATVSVAAPTTSDVAFITANASTGTIPAVITTNVAVSTSGLNFTGFTGTFTGNTTVQTSTGGLTLGSGMTMSQTGTWTIVGTSTVTSAGKTLPNLTISGSAITVTLGDALSLTSALTLNQGTLTTSASNYGITADSITSVGSLTRTLTLNASAVNLTGITPFNFGGTSFTLNSGTSQISVSNSSPSIDIGGKTISNLIISNSSLVSANLSAASGSIGNLTVAARSSTGRGVLNLTNNPTVTGTFTVTAGTNATYRLKINGNGSTFTAASVSLTDVDFYKVTGAGAATWSGTRLGNVGGNSGITFPTAKSVYWNLAGTQSISATGWATSSGGTPAANNFPLAQDTIVLDNNGSIGTLNFDGFWDFGTFDASARTSAATIGLLSNQFFIGSWTNGTGLTFSSSALSWQFNGIGTQTINGNGVAFSGTVSQTSVTGTITLASNLIAQNVSIGNSTFNFNNFNVTATNEAIFIGNGTLAFGTTGKVILNGSGLIFDNSLFAGTITGNNLISVTYSGSVATSINAFSNTVSNFEFVGGTYPLTINDGSFFNNLTFTGYTGACTIGGSSIANSILGNLVLSSGMTTVSNSGTLQFSNISASQNITSNGVSLLATLLVTGTGTGYPYPTLILQDNLNVSVFEIDQGTLNLNGKTLTNLSFSVGNIASNNISFGGGTIVCNGSGIVAFQNFNGTSFTTTGSGTIKLTSSSAKTFSGGGATYSCTLQQAGTGTLTITGANTFAKLESIVNNCTIIFPASTTTTVTSWNVNGAAGNLITLNSSISGTQFTLAGTDSTTKNSNYLIIKDSNATNGTWNAYYSTSVSNNSGNWNIVSSGPPVTGNQGRFLIFF